MAHACSIPLAIPFSELNATVPLPDKRPFPCDLQSIGDHIKHFRLANNLSIKEIIAELGIDRETLRSWELNLFEPFVKHYPKIILLLGYYPFNFEEESLGGKIKKYRFCNGLSQQQFADILNTDRSTVWQWENNRCLPIAKTLKEIHKLIDLKK